MQPSVKMPFQDWSPDTASIYNPGMTTVQNCLPTLASPNYTESPSLVLSAIGQPNSGPYAANATSFVYNSGAPTTSPSMLLASNLAGIANGQAGAISLWIRLDGSTGGEQTIFEIAAGFTPAFRVSYNAAGHLQNFRIVGANSSGTTILDISTSAGYSPGTKWLNLLASWNLATGATNLFINGVSDKTQTTATNDTLNYAAAGAFALVGISRAITNELFASLSEVWFNTGFIDFSSSGNRSNFISGGFPVNLGSVGQTPTGSSPLLYFKSAAGQFNVNSGTGGNFTIANGPLAIASTSPSIGSTPSQCLGSASVIDANGLPHTYAGNSSQLFEITATSSVNVSKSAGYSCQTYWKYAPYTAEGVNNIYATDYTDAIQVMAIGGTAFADLGGGAPKAQHIGQIGQFIMAGNTNGGTIGGNTQGAVPNRVQWPAIGNPGSWPDPLTNAGIAAEAGWQDLPLVYGKVQHISNGQLFGLVFQEHAITNFYYIGGSDVFQINTYEKQRGLYCPNGACQVGDVVYFIDSSGFFATDGATVQPIGHDLVDQTWLADVNTAYLDHVRAAHDPDNKLIYWQYPSISSTLLGGFIACDKVIVYNYVNKRWGMGYTAQSLDVLMSAFTLGYTMEQMDSVNSNLDLIFPSLDSPVWNGGIPIVGAFALQQIGSTGTYASYFATLTGPALTATLQTKTVNANQGGRALCTAFKPIVVGATPANITGSIGTQILPTDAITWTAGVTPETRTGKCSVRADGVFHTGQVVIAGGFANALGIEPEFTSSGYA